MLLIVAVPGTSAQGYTVGASGECFDDGSGGVTDGGGDDAEVRAGDDTEDSANTVEVDALTATGAAFAAVQLVEGIAGEGSPPDNNCDGNPNPSSGDTGYLEVHAGDGGTPVFVQVCWNGDAGDAATVGGTSCATDTQADDGPQVGV